MKKIIFLFLLVFSFSANAGELSFPLACEYGKDCFIQNYVDVDPTNNYLDYNCALLTYNGNEGTDFRLKNYAQMREGVEVIAAADGVIIAVRDGMQDINANIVDKATIKDRNLGNTVIVNHGNEINVVYSHLKNGSIIVQKGEKLKRGDKIGLVGLSGNTVFPHLNFVVKKEGTVVDPFTGKSMGMGCESGKLNTDTSLWNAETLAKLRYKDAVILGAGFVDYIPEPEKIREEKSAVKISNQTENIIYWADIMGVKQGDSLVMEIKSPTGTLLARQQTDMDKAKALYFKYVGKKRTTSVWEPGVYTATVSINREGRPVTQISENLTIE